MPTRVLFRTTLVLLSAAVLYRGLFVQLRVAGVVANVFLLCAVAAGIAGGPERGAVVGFFAGLLMDLVLPSGPVGLGALTFCLVGYFVGRAQGSVVRSARWVTMLTAAVASAAGTLAYVGIGQIVNQVNLLQRQLWVVVLIVSVVNAVLAPLAVRILRWSLDVSSGWLRPAMR